MFWALSRRQLQYQDSRTRMPRRKILCFGQIQPGEVGLSRDIDIMQEQDQAEPELIQGLKRPGELRIWKVCFVLWNEPIVR
jgi:hypothetical protein